MDHPPPGYLEQPRYRVPAAFKETRLGLDMLLAACGEDGVFPLDQKRNATMDGREEVVIPPAVIIFVSRSPTRVPRPRPASESRQE
jgi:hypothetical protein